MSTSGLVDSGGDQCRGIADDTRYGDRARAARIMRVMIRAARPAVPAFDELDTREINDAVPTGACREWGLKPSDYQLDGGLKQHFVGEDSIRCWCELRESCDSM